jgi:glycosyltransferase involved in cell wall biosynthesis
MTNGVLYVVIPIYNERGTLEECLRRVINAPLPEGWRPHVVMIDDCSDEAHSPAVNALAKRLEAQGISLTFLQHAINRGKGAALQSGFDAIIAGGTSGDSNLVIIQDADLEYDPGDYAKLMQPILAHKADAVLGTRWGEHYRYKSLKHRVHALGNGVLTIMSNFMTGFRVNDMECCYKMMPVALLRKLRPLLSEQRFGIEPQIVAGLARLGAKVVEVPINYNPRGPSAGKKIGWKDGLRAMYVIARERFRPMPRENEAARQHG